MAEAQAETQVRDVAAEATLSTDEFQQLLQKEFRPQTDAAKSAIRQSVQTLAEQALVNTALISTEVVRSIEAMMREHMRQHPEVTHKSVAYDAVARTPKGRAILARDRAKAGISV